jgi:hypothetical protein
MRLHLITAVLALLLSASYALADQAEDLAAESLQKRFVDVVRDL